MAEPIPITSGLLTWARERAGLTVADMEANNSFKNIAKWEAGTAFPTYTQLEKLAEVLKVPVAVFFFPAPPTLPPITETFRTLPGAELERLPSRIRLLLRKAKAMQINLHELTEGKNPYQRLITQELSFAPDASVAPQMAQAVRQFIGISIQEQRSWTDDDEALKNWRSALLQVGVFVFKDAFRIDDYSGFCLYDDTFPVIYVNNSASKTRQIFTYFHELAHLIFHTSGIDPLSDRYISRLQQPSDKTIEILCNRFAAEFLLPDQEFIKAIKGLPATAATAEAIAADFHVSREVVFRRFLDKGQIKQSDYEAAIKRWNEQRQAVTAESGGNHYWTKIAYLGRDYMSLALAQFHRERISEYQLADYLDTKPKNLGTLEEYYERGIG
jgi:Zn-dependent peptidase ImmA (M78 family)/transcriptional regulator with XRE-family HTH domain